MTKLDLYLADLRSRINDFIGRNGLSKSSFGDLLKNDKILNGLDRETSCLSSIRKIELLIAEKKKSPRAKKSRAEISHVGARSAVHSKKAALSDESQIKVTSRATVLSCKELRTARTAKNSSSGENSQC